MREAILDSDSDTSSIVGSKKRQKRATSKKLQVLRNQLIEEKFGYSNAANPFNDPNLSKPFIWVKKKKLLAAKGEDTSPDDTYLSLSKEKFDEIDRIRRHREERERETALLQEQQELLARERELENYQSWAQKVEVHHREAVYQRSLTRLKESRPLLIDQLLKVLWISEGYAPFEDLDLLPCSVDVFLQNLSREDLEGLKTEVVEQAALCSIPDPKSNADMDERALQYWTALAFLIEEQLRNQESQRGAPTSKEKDDIRDVTTGIALAAVAGLKSLFSSKTVSELKVIEDSVQAKLKSLKHDLQSQEDPTYWESIAEMLPLYQKMAHCREVYSKALEHQKLLKALRHQPDPEPLTRPDQKSSHQIEPSTETSLESDVYAPPLVNCEVCKNAPIITREQFQVNWLDMFSQYVQHRKEWIAKLAAKYEDGPASKESERAHVKTKQSESNAARLFYEQFVKNEKLQMEEDELIMTSAYEISVERPVSEACSQNDFNLKYKPRKPRYFNRIKTGYDWCKYNQTHYDRDNPPPKIVQGYKFNIFYFDLIDPSQTPSWKLHRGQTKETVLLRFHSGPPYEDIQFHIINREWDLDPRSGFKNTFERGVLQLHFKFKKFRYRR